MHMELVLTSTFCLCFYSTLVVSIVGIIRRLGLLKIINLFSPQSIKDSVFLTKS